MERIASRSNSSGVCRRMRSQIWVPLHPALRAEIALRLHPKSELIAPSPTGMVWDKNNFARRFRAVREAAGLPEGLQFRDLRRTAMVRLAEAGASLAQIAAVSGHPVGATGPADRGVEDHPAVLEAAVLREARLHEVALAHAGRHQHPGRLRLRRAQPEADTGRSATGEFRMTEGTTCVAQTLPKPESTWTAASS